MGHQACSDDGRKTPHGGDVHSPGRANHASSKMVACAARLRATDKSWHQLHFSTSRKVCDFDSSSFYE